MTNTSVRKTALVTGANRGIGQRVAARLARDGLLIAVHHRGDESRARGTLELIEREGGEAFTVRGDLTEPAEVGALFEQLAVQLRAHTGRVELHVLVNNAARTGPGTPFDQVTPELLDEYWRINARAPFLLIQGAVRLMHQGGRIVNVSSGLPHTSFPEQVAYAMSKAALEQLARQLAPLVAERGITINTVVPGRTDNGDPIFDNPNARAAMSRLSVFDRVGQPEDIADVVAFVASEQARWVTGSLVDATGGALLGR